MVAESNALNFERADAMVATSLVAGVPQSFSLSEILAVAQPQCKSLWDDCEIISDLLASA